jgi:hypothetical protein
MRATREPLCHARVTGTICNASWGGQSEVICARINIGHLTRDSLGCKEDGRKASSVACMSTPLNVKNCIPAK